jgi:hypothetical protein
LSFFDEADEPRTVPRPAPRRRGTSGGGRRPPGDGGGSRPPRDRGTRRPPGDQQAIQVRRVIAVVVLAVFIILVVVGVHSCAVSARNDALKNYNSNVFAVIGQSNATGHRFFTILTSGGGPRSEQTSINQSRVSADNQLSHARKFDVPDQAKTAQQDLELALQMRRDGIANVARNIQQALGGTTSRDAVTAISTEMARMYASDVLYKDYTLPLVLGALRSAGIAVGGTEGQQINAGQFVPDIRWLQPTFVASQLHTNLGTSSTTSVSVAGTTLQTGSTNTLTASPAPTFTLNFSNTGQNTETNVVCKVTISNSTVSGQTIVPQTTAGESTSCDVPLGSAPPKGSYTVTATIEGVPGEKNKANNTMTFPVTFQ